ncbi:MAG TPA: hypothetical protein VJH20_06130 [Candidatus Nanoarchaeia archaeon]|nr:hypothetical protein [Candidatus Pacearchaeota archaeon]HLC74184.1 hypothetical protein [Candidatus Nanoarchaeia archaeon]
MGETLEIKATLIEKNDNSKPESSGHIGLLDIGSRYYLVKAPKEIDDDITQKAHTYGLLRNLLEDCNRRGITVQEVSLDYTRP